MTDFWNSFVAALVFSIVSFLLNLLIGLSAPIDSRGGRDIADGKV